MYNNRGLAKHALADSKVEIGKNEIAMKFYMEAIADFTKAIKIDANDAGYWNNRANSKRLIEDYEGSLKDCDNAIRIEPDYYPSYLNRAATRLHYANIKNNEDFVKAYKEIIDDYTSAIKLNRTLIPAYLSRGVAYFMLGSMMGEQHEYTNCISYYQQSIDDLSMVTESEPNNAIAYQSRALSRYGLGQIKSEQGANEESSRLYQDALNDSNEAIQNMIQMGMQKLMPATYHTRADIYVELKDHEKAIGDYDEVIRDNPKDAIVLFKRGLVKTEIGEHEQAEKDFTAAKKLDPDIENKLNKGA